MCQEYDEGDNMVSTTIRPPDLFPTVENYFCRYKKIFDFVLYLLWF